MRCLVLVLCGVAACSLPVVADPSDIVSLERQRRAENVKAAREALVEGDRAYRLGDYQQAVDSYTRARDLIPDSALTAEERSYATERLAQSAVERARALARIGRVEEADSLLEAILAPGVAPDYAPAAQMREQIHDPIRYNPAVTPEHVAAVDKVRRLLYEAQGFADLGQYDRAIMFYEDVLRIDRFNAAARRGIAAVTNHKRVYYAAAHDEARQSLLTQVDQAWELPVPQEILDLDSGLGAVRDPDLLGSASPSEKLESIILPVIDMDQVNLQDAIDFLRQQSAAQDTFETVQERRGVAFVIDLGTGSPERTAQIMGKRFDLKLRNIPLGKALEYINEVTATVSRADQHAVVIRPAGAVGDEFVNRKFRVPPDFLSRESLQDDGGDADPFGDDGPNRGLVKRLTALEFLKDKGVPFPPGASATFSPSGGILTVRNTETNMRLVESLVEVMSETEPIMITIQARIIRATEQTLEELGFDWLIGGPKISGDFYLGGGSVGNGTPITNNPFLRPITAGNRSGNLATDKNSIDAVINRASSDDSFLRAPGAVQAFGFINDETVGAIMRGVNQHTGLDLMTNKSVITRPGQTASIHSVREFIYPTEYEPPELPNQVGGAALIDPLTGQVIGGGASAIATPATPTAFETTNLGCMMEVLPQIGSDRKIVEVSIKPEIREFDGFINYGTPIQGGTSSTLTTALGTLTSGNFGQITDNAILMPVISTLRGNTTLTIADGETVVLGGLLNHSRIKVQDHTPVLGSIPFIGRLFETNSYTSVREAYVILVTVRLQDAAGEPINRR